jgi:predicted RNA-binding protein
MKKRRYWVGVINEENFEILLEKNLFGLKYDFQKRVKNLDAGDFIVFYILGKKIAGVFEITSKPYETNKEIFNRYLYPIRFDLKKIGKVEKKNLLNSLIAELSFIKNKINWGGHFQGKAIIEISENDFNKIKEYLKNEK